jgi:hypothetical protein
VQRNGIALQYATLKQDTSRYREEMQTKFKYPAETTANAAKIPRQMSLFIKQDQITTNLRNGSSNYNTRKTPLNYTKKKKPKTSSEQTRQSHYNSQFNLNKQAYAQHKNTLQKEQSDAPCNFMKLIISI